jgi:hypothetical protein
MAAQTARTDKTVQEVAEKLGQEFFGTVFRLPREDRFVFHMHRGGPPPNDGVPIIEVRERTPRRVQNEARRRARVRKIRDIINLPQ